MTASRFIDLLLFSDGKLDQVSLNDLVSDFNEQYHCSITKQGLQERFNNKAVAFMTALLKATLTDQLSVIDSISRPSCTRFKRIRIKDSTRFTLPQAYAAVYKGHGGITSPSQISIQYEYDLLTGKAMELALTSACRNDQQDSKETLDSIEKGDLLIRDLAYAGQSYLARITELGAYYLNRLNTTWHVYNQEGELIDFGKLYKKIAKYDLPAIEIEAFIKVGKKRLKTRLIVSKINKGVYEKRIKKAKNAASSKGYQVSDGYKMKAWLNMFITNIPSQWLATNQIRKTYSLRWQIELIFKIWKSQAKINSIKPVRIARFQCQLIARFIWLLIHWQALGIAQYWIHQLGHRCLCSPWKFYKAAFRLSPLLRETIFGDAPCLVWLETLITGAEKKFCTEKKKGKPNTFLTLQNLLA